MGKSIVFVHGLQGHPQRTWSSAPVSDRPRDSTLVTENKKHRFWAKTAATKRKPNETTVATQQVDIYWPYHLLPKDCQHSRILTWGYDSKVASFFQGATNKNHIFAHSRDLFSDLKGRRQSCVSSV